MSWLMPSLTSDLRVGPVSKQSYSIVQSIDPDTGTFLSVSILSIVAGRCNNIPTALLSQYIFAFTHLNDLTETIPSFLSVRDQC